MTSAGFLSESTLLAALNAVCKYFNKAKQNFILEIKKKKPDLNLNKISFEQ